MTDEIETLRSKLKETERRLAATEAVLQAIRNGEVDALVIEAGDGPAVYTLKSAGEPYRLLIEQMADGALTMSQDGVVLYCNASFASMVQRPREQLIGTSFRDLVSGAHNVPCLPGETCSGREVALKTPLGFLPVLMSCSHIGIDEEQIACVVVTDISTQRQTLEHALQAAKAGAWSWDLASGTVTWSPENDDVFGIEHGRVRCRGDWNSLVHPDDRAAANQAVDDAVAGRAPQVVTEFRTTRPDGEVRWIAGHGRLERAADGTPLRLTGINLDITERKRAEAVLRAAHETLCELVEESPFGVYIVDADLRFAYASTSVVQLFNCGPIVGRDFSDVLRSIRSDSYTKDRVGMFRETLETGRSHGGTVATLRRGTTTEESFEWRIQRITMPDGRYGVVCHYYDLSEREKYENELRQSRSALHATLDSIGDGFFAVDGDWRLLYANAAAERILDLRSADVLGRSIWHIFPLTVGSKLEEEYRRAAAGQTRDFENFYEPWQRWFHHRCFPRQGGGISVYFRDITEHKKAQEDLRQSEARYRMLHESLRDPFVRTTIDGQILEFNDLYREMLGYSAEELLTLSYRDLTPQRWHTMEARVVREQILARGYSDVYQKEYRRKDGCIIPVELRTILSRDAAGNPESMWAIVRDDTERKANEDRLRSLNEQLMHVGRLGELSQVSATIAHEMNQPLAAMLNYAGVAKRLAASSDPLARQKAATAIEKAGEQAVRASEIIRRMRGFVERRTTERKAESINMIAEEAIALALIGAKAESITTRIDLAPDLPAVFADRVQIQQVLVNLLHNAVDALTDSDRREIAVSTQLSPDDGVLVKVADSGSGIPKELASRLFTPFVTTKPGGMGIGLAISRNIIEAHEGEMGVETSPSGGALFWFTLPAMS